METNINNKEVQKLHLGSSQLDEIIDGWKQPELIIIAGRPAMGKTPFGGYIIKRMAIEHKIPCALFSLEKSFQQFMEYFMKNKLSDAELHNECLSEQIDNRIHKLYNVPLYIDDTPSLSFPELDAKVRKLVEDYGVKMILIDYLQLIDSGKQVEERSSLIRNLKELSLELSISIIALSQLYGPLVPCKDKRPQLDDLREWSLPMMQYADKVCFIHRPEYYDVFEENGESVRGMGEFIINDCRNGCKSVIKFKSDLIGIRC